jgi:opacity protein-like surface antigen
MRLVIAGAIAATLVADVVRAADMPVLRGSSVMEIGPPRYYRWDGFYVGGHAGYAAASLGFASSTSDLVGHILRNTSIENEFGVSNWTVLGNTSTSGTSYGGFAGYNMQWENAVIGLELTYDRSGLSGSSSDSIARRVQTSTGYLYDVDLSSQASFKIQDYATLRLRGGWSAGWFMPYIFGAAVVARVDALRSATVTTSGIDISGLDRPPVGSGPTTREDRRDGAFAYGYAGGLGVDVAIMANLFVRAEWEYLHITYDPGFYASINTIRAGLGWRF